MQKITHTALCNLVGQPIDSTTIYDGQQVSLSPVTGGEVVATCEAGGWQVESATDIDPEMLRAATLYSLLVDFWGEELGKETFDYIYPKMVTLAPSVLYQR